ncbi:unnamed protein product [Closterium sp. NIES-64]|nr:unnamed protein product [Closterium sp. NIES-64]
MADRSAASTWQLLPPASTVIAERVAESPRSTDPRLLSRGRRIMERGSDPPPLAADADVDAAATISGVTSEAGPASSACTPTSRSGASGLVRSARRRIPAPTSPPRAASSESPMSPGSMVRGARSGSASAPRGGGASPPFVDGSVLAIHGTSEGAIVAVRKDALSHCAPSDFAVHMMTPCTRRSQQPAAAAQLSPASASASGSSAEARRRAGSHRRSLSCPSHDALMAEALQPLPAPGPRMARCSGSSNNLSLIAAATAPTPAMPSPNRYRVLSAASAGSPPSDSPPRATATTPGATVNRRGGTRPRGLDSSSSFPPACSSPVFTSFAPSVSTTPISPVACPTTPSGLPPRSRKPGNSHSSAYPQASPRPASLDEPAMFASDGDRLRATSPTFVRIEPPSQSTAAQIMASSPWAREESPRLTAAMGRQGGFSTAVSPNALSPTAFAFPLQSDSILSPHSVPVLNLPSQAGRTGKASASSQTAGVMTANAFASDARVAPLPSDEGSDSDDDFMGLYETVAQRRAMVSAAQHMLAAAASAKPGPTQAHSTAASGHGGGSQGVSGVVSGAGDGSGRQPPLSPSSRCDNASTHHRSDEAMSLRPVGLQPLDAEEFRAHAHRMVDYIADYYRDIESHPVRSTVEPGYLQHHVPESAPEEGEPLDKILADVSGAIMPGITHWQSPSFFAFFPANSSTPALLADMLCSALNVVAFNWLASPAATELETRVLDWFARLLLLPPAFLASDSGGRGGGVIQGTASEAVLVAVLAAREKALRALHAQHQQQQHAYSHAAAGAGAGGAGGEGGGGEGAAVGSGGGLERLVAYVSDQTHSCVKKACQVRTARPGRGMGMGMGMKIAGIPSGNLRVLATSASESYALQPSTLQEAVATDTRAGLVPFFLTCTVGTTSSTAVDPIEPLAAIAQAHGMWVHVDAAYGGAACVCEEHQQHLAGVQHVQSLAVNAHKWLLTNFDCCCLWTQDTKAVQDALTTTPEYLRNKASDNQRVLDYKDWQVPLGRRFRALKLWFVLRMFGAAQLRAYIRHHVSLACWFEAAVCADARFQLMAPRTFALVCFRLRPPGQAEQHTEGHGGGEQGGGARGGGGDEGWVLNEALLEAVNSSGKAFLTHTLAAPTATWKGQAQSLTAAGDKSSFFGRLPAVSRSPLVADVSVVASRPAASRRVSAAPRASSGLIGVSGDVVSPRAARQKIPPMQPVVMTPSGPADLMSAFLRNRIIFVGSAINQQMAQRVIQQLLALSAVDDRQDIKMYINCPGGSTYSVLAIYDCMAWIKPDVQTVAFGMTASQGALLLAAGTKGKRLAMPNSRIMIHQPQGGCGGTSEDVRRQVNEVMSSRDKLDKMFSAFTGQPVELIQKYTERDRFFSAAEAMEFGLIDGLLETEY